jgi:hypothetical protein
MSDDGLGRIDRAPTRLSSVLALGAAVLTTATSAYSPLAFVCCLVGGLVLAAGLAGGDQRAVTTAGGLLIVGVLAGGVAGAPVAPTLVGVTGAVLAVDLGSTALAVGEQLGRKAPTTRLELVHATGSVLVGLGLVTGGVVVHEAAAGSQPVTAVFGLVVAVVVLFVALRRMEPVPD